MTKDEILVELQKDLTKRLKRQNLIVEMFEVDFRDHLAYIYRKNGGGMGQIMLYNAEVH